MDRKLASGRDQQRGKFLPYAFALSFAGILAKALISAATHENIIDYMFYGLLIIFAITSILYAVAKRAPGNSTHVKIEIRGDTDGSTLIGTDGPIRGPAEIEMIVKGRAKNTTMTGRR